MNEEVCIATRKASFYITVHTCGGGRAMDAGKSGDADHGVRQ